MHIGTLSGGSTRHIVLIAMGLTVVLYFVAKRIPARADHHSAENVIESNNLPEATGEVPHTDGDGHAY